MAAIQSGLWPRECQETVGGTAVRVHENDCQGIPCAVGEPEVWPIDMIPQQGVPELMNDHPHVVSDAHGLPRLRHAEAKVSDAISGCIAGAMSVALEVERPMIDRHRESRVIEVGSQVEAHPLHQIEEPIDMVVGVDGRKISRFGVIGKTEWRRRRRISHDRCFDFLQVHLRPPQVLWTAGC